VKPSISGGISIKPAQNWKTLSSDRSAPPRASTPLSKPWDSFQAQGQTWSWSHSPPRRTSLRATPSNRAGRVESHYPADDRESINTDRRGSLIRRCERALLVRSGLQACAADRHRRRPSNRRRVGRSARCEIRREWERRGSCGPKCLRAGEPRGGSACWPLACCWNEYRDCLKSDICGPERTSWRAGCRGRFRRGRGGGGGS